jgi:uncharacterized membrane protein
LITSGFTYLATLMFVSGCLKFVETRSRNRVFNYLPAIVLLYFGVMLLSTAGLWERNEDIDAAYLHVRNNLVPAMIFLMLLKSDLRLVLKLGPRMLLGFFAATTTIIIGFVVSFALFHDLLADESWKTYAALSGSWIGGTANMAAVQSALDVPDSGMGYALLIDSIDYAIWVAILLALVPFAKIFNRWTKADVSELETAGNRLNATAPENSRPPDATDLMLLTGIALLAAAVVQTFAALLPSGDFLTTNAWTIMIITVAGVAAASTPLGRMPGSQEISTLLLYLVIALIASRADFASLAQAPVYIVSGLLILLIHAVLLSCVAKLFRLDLFTCGVASLANIGGVASAPILAASYSHSLIPVGVLMAMLGYIVGTAGGLLTGRILLFIAS